MEHRGANTELAARLAELLWGDTPPRDMYDDIISATSEIVKNKKSIVSVVDVVQHKKNEIINLLSSFIDTERIFFDIITPSDVIITSNFGIIELAEQIGCKVIFCPSAPLSERISASNMSLDHGLKDIRYEGDDIR